MESLIWHHPRRTAPHHPRTGSGWWFAVVIGFAWITIDIWRMGRLVIYSSVRFSSPPKRQISNYAVCYILQNTPPYAAYAQYFPFDSEALPLTMRLFSGIVGIVLSGFCLSYPHYTSTRISICPYVDSAPQMLSSLHSVILSAAIHSFTQALIHSLTHSPTVLRRKSHPSGN